MLYFNLLPQQKKEEFKREKLYLIIEGILKSLFLLLLCTLILFLSTYFSLEYLSSFQKNELEKMKKTKAMAEVLILDSQVSSANKLINEVYSIQQEIVFFAPVIEKIVYLTPTDGIYITEINVEKKIEGQESSQTEIQSPAITDSSTISPSSSPSPSPTATSNGGGEQSPPKEYYQVKILGFAPDRQQVIEFKEKLEAEKSFTNVISPLQNILKSKNIDFEFTFRIKK